MLNTVVEWIPTGDKRSGRNWLNQRCFHVISTTKLDVMTLNQRCFHVMSTTKIDVMTLKQIEKINQRKKVIFHFKINIQKHC